MVAERAPRRAPPDPIPVDPLAELPLGATPAAGGGFCFRVWAPRAARVEVVFEREDVTEAYLGGPRGRNEDVHEWGDDVQE